MTEYFLGRKEALDARDKSYKMASVLPVESVSSRFWNDHYWWGNQGAFPHCVGYAWAHYMEDGPIRPSSNTPPPRIDPVFVYNEAQRIDEWPGEDYDGTSIRAGCKILHAHGYVKEYRWAWDAETVKQAILTVGPVVVGTNWYSSMFNPDANGYIVPTGTQAGGHAYLLNGYDESSHSFRIKNSWGQNWGKNGRAFITYQNMDSLLKNGGEAVISTEIGTEEGMHPDAIRLRARAKLVRNWENLARAQGLTADELALDEAADIMEFIAVLKDQGK